MLKNRTVQVIAVLGFIGVVIAAGLAYAFLRAPEEASAPISSIPIEDVTDPTDEPNDPPETSEDVDEPTQETQEDGKSSFSEGVVIFEIVPAESEARFTLGEILRGQDNTVVGSTDQVAGQISIDFGDPSASQVGTIQVNARTLATDNNFRDRAIKNQILDTNTYEFITFTPTSISGWPQAAVIGELIELEIVGELTIRDVTMEVTFTVTVVAVSETRLEGSGATIVAYADYGITIPDVAAVASVDDEVLLEIEFVAIAMEQ